MTKQIYLTGITTTGTPHLGNYVGAIRPAIEASRDAANESFYFLADYHALIKTTDPDLVRQSRLEIAATWLATGLDPNKVTFYRQSDIPEIPELTWMLTCSTAKGLMNRAHAYKALVQENEENSPTDQSVSDPDRGITMGLFSYPILMAADILMFGAHKVPVGRDQIQHLEMTRDIAQRFNHRYGELLTIPEVVFEERTAVLAGLDGRKMSKSYNNTIPIFESEKKLRKSIMKIKTDSLEPGDAKDSENNALFEIYRAFASDEQTAEMREKYAAGIGWGDAKQLVFECINASLAEPREKYLELMQSPAKIDEILNHGADKARVYSSTRMRALRDATGISSK